MPDCNVQNENSAVTDITSNLKCEIWGHYTCYFQKSACCPQMSQLFYENDIDNYIFLLIGHF